MENNVKIYLHSPNANKPTPLMLVFNYGYRVKKSGKMKYQRLKMAVGFSIHPKDWSPDFQQIPPTSRYREKIKINAAIGKLKSKVLTSFQYFWFQGVIPTVKQLRQHILKDEPTQLFDAKTPIMAYIKRFLADSDIKKNTLQNYIRLTNAIRRFEVETKSELYFETMDAAQFRSFFKFSGQKPIKYRREVWATHTQNSIADFKKNLRKFFNMAKRTGIMVHEDYSLKEFTPNYVVTDAVYITHDRLHQLINFDLEKAGRPNLQSTKEQLLIGCCTGLRDSDRVRLGWDPLESTCRHASLSIL